MGLYIKNCIANPQKPRFGEMGKVATVTKKFTFISQEGVMSFLSIFIYQKFNRVSPVFGLTLCIWIRLNDSISVLSLLKKQIWLLASLL